jgi:hypothetical protein
MRAVRGHRAGDAEVALSKMKSLKNIAENRFAACRKSRRLIIFSTEAVRRAMTGSLFTEFHFSVGRHFRDDSTSPIAGTNLTRHEIFRGKVSWRKNQN